MPSLREQAMEGQSPQVRKIAKNTTASMETASPPATDVWVDYPRDETIITPTYPIPFDELPATYGEDYIVLLTRDPAWMFAYWEITPQGWSHARGNLSDCQCQTILRVYDLDPASQRPQGHYDITIQPYSQGWHIQTGKLGGSFQVAIGIRTPEGAFREIARSNSITAPRGTVSPIVDEQWLTVEEFYWLAQPPQPGHSPMEWQKHREGQISALGAYPTSPGMFSPMGVGFGKPIQEEQALAKLPFFLELHTELILHGRTTPGASVTVAGEAISLSDDGTFTLRYELPDGAFCLPVKAISPDNQEQSITPLITRQTEKYEKQL